MLRLALWFNLRRMRRRPLRGVLAVISVAAGVSLAISVVILTASVSHSLTSFGRQVAGPAPLAVIGATAAGGIDSSVLPRIVATPGVATAVPMVQAVTYAHGSGRAETPVAVFGIDCRASALFGSFGCTPQAIAALARSGGAAISPVLARQIGPGGYLLTNGDPVTVKGSIQVAALDRFDHGAVAVFALPTAQRLFGRAGRYDVIYVIPDPGTAVPALQARLRAEVGAWNGVVPADAPPPVVAVVTDTVLPIFGLISLFALVIGGLLIFNIMSLALEERRRELAIMAALGASPVYVTGGVAVEGMVIGLSGGVLGVVGGAVLARPLTASLSTFTRQAIGVPIGVHVTVAAALIAVGLGVAVGTVAAVVPSRRALRMDVASELSAHDLAPESLSAATARRIGALLVVAVIGLVVCWVASRRDAIQPWQAALAPIGALVCTVFLTLGLAGVAAAIPATFGRHTSRFGGAVRLGVANLARQGRRAGVMAVAIGAALATAFVIGSTHTAAAAAISHNITQGHPQEVYVATAAAGTGGGSVAAPSAPTVAALRKLPGVAAVDGTYFELSGHTSSDLVGVFAADTPWLTQPVLAGRDDRADFDRGRALVGVALARQRGLRPGSILVLDTPTGLARVTVGGVWEDGNLNGQSVMVPVWLFDRLFGAQPPQSIGLRPAPGYSLDRLAAEVRASPVATDLVVETPRQEAASIASGVNRQLAPFSAMQRALMIVAFVAVLSTLLLVGVQRRREMGLLAAVGMEPAQLAGMTVAEGVTAGVVSVAVALFGSIVIAVAFALVLPIDIGFKDPIRLDFPALAVWGPALVVLVAVATVLPAWRNAGVPVVESLQYE